MRGRYSEQKSSSPRSKSAIRGTSMKHCFMPGPVVQAQGISNDPKPPASRAVHAFCREPRNSQSRVNSIVASLIQESQMGLFQSRLMSVRPIFRSLLDGHSGSATMLVTTIWDSVIQGIDRPRNGTTHIFRGLYLGRNPGSS